MTEPDQNRCACGSDLAGNQNGCCDDCARELGLRVEDPMDVEPDSTLTVYKELEQRSPEWYAARCGVVTASAVAALVTPTLRVADNDESRGLTSLLVSERIAGWVDETYVNAAMWHGIEAEPVARDLYSTSYQQAEEVGFMVREGDGWTLGYSPDGLVGMDGLIEIKAPKTKTHVGYVLADEVPPAYMAQCQAGLLVSGRQWLDFVSYCGGLPLFVKRVLPDPAWHEAIVAAVRQFETNAAEMVAAYRKKTKGLPSTKRFDPNIVELKLA